MVTGPGIGPGNAGHGIKATISMQIFITNFYSMENDLNFINSI
jgi:hypothetical protein